MSHLGILSDLFKKSLTIGMDGAKRNTVVFLFFPFQTERLLMILSILLKSVIFHILIL